MKAKTECARASNPSPCKGEVDPRSGSGGDHSTAHRHDPSQTARFNRTRGKTERARALRRNATKPEAKLWSVLRGSPLGVSFRRQHPVGSYVLDFYCPKLKLAIELDGSQHFDRQDHDGRRTRYLNGKGIHVIRFWNGEVNENFDGVCERIADVVRELTPTRPASKSRAQIQPISRSAIYRRGDLPLSGGGDRSAAT